MAYATARSVTLLVYSLIRLQYKHVFVGCPSVRWAWAAVTAAVALRSAVLREVWELVADAPRPSTGAAHTHAPLEHVEDTIDVCARGLAELLVAPSQDRERCRSGCLECAASVLRAFARAALLTEDSQPSAARLLRTVDDRLASHENSVLSGEQTYALDLDALRQIPATVGASPPEPASDGNSEPAAAWEALEQTAVAVLVSAARAVANIDTVGVGAAPPASAPTVVLGQLRVIVARVERGARDLPEEPQRESDRVGRLLSEVLRIGLPKQALEDLTRADASTQALSEALGEVRSTWLDLAARELEIVRLLDDEMSSPSYAQSGSLRQTVTAGAANVLAGGRLLDRPGEFHLLDALIHQHDGLAHAVELYTAALRGHTDARTQTQLVVLTRLLRAVAALWVIDAREAGTREVSRRAPTARTRQ